MKQFVEKSLCYDNNLVRIFALLDKRVEKRTLLKLRNTYFEQPKQLQYFYKLRFDVEGISIPNTMPLLLSADGDIRLYSANIEIVENLNQYLDEFYNWKTYRCYNEEDFVRYLWKKKGTDVKFLTYHLHKHGVHPRPKSQVYTT